MNTTGKIIVVCLANALLFSLQAAEPRQTEGEKERSAEDQNAILDTIAQINHINWVVNVIKTYDNAVVLEEEYEKISYGNLNLNRIPDEETLGRITKTLDTLHSLRKDEREMKHWREKFRDERTRKMRKYELESARSTYELFRGSVLDVLTGDIGMVAQAVFGIVHGSLSLQYDYEDFIHGLDQEQRERVFAFDSKKLDLLHQQNKEMLDDQWRLVRKYHLDDKATRVTDVDIRSLLAVLKDGNTSRIYTRLVAMKDRYRMFPEFWYYLSCAAIETGHFKEGSAACDIFFKVNRGIFRDDPMAGTVALNKALVLGKDKDCLSELRRYLEITWKNNQSRNEWAQDYVVASLYDGVLHEKEKAVDVLQHAIVGLESKMSEVKHGTGGDFITLAATLAKYHEYLFNLLPNESMPETIRASEFISFADKLRYLARSKETNLWETIKGDILGVGVVDNSGSMTCVGMTIPISWVLSGESFKGKFAVAVGDVTLVEWHSFAITNLNDKCCTIMFDSSTVSYDQLELKRNEVANVFGLSEGAPLPDALLFRYSFDHLPVELTFAPKGMGFLGESKDPFLFKFSIFGKEYFWDSQSELEAPKYSSYVTPQQRRDSFVSKFGFVPIDCGETLLPNNWVVHGVRLLKIRSGKEVSIDYRNDTQSNFRPCVTLAFMNEYGMLIDSISDKYYDKYNRTERTDPGLFIDDHYADYHYQYMSPSETRTFSIPVPKMARYVSVLVSVNYELTKTIKLW